jgi:hypothetical protein
MATYTLISSNVLTASQTSVTFSAIPATYTDLVLRISARSDILSMRGSFTLFPNSETDSSTLGSNTVLYGIAGSAASSRRSNTYPYRDMYDLDAANATANTFSSIEIYIPSYTASQNKPLSNFGVSENNSANDPLIGITAGLYRSTSGITSLKADLVTANFVSGSSFYLYGISNA